MEIRTPPPSSIALEKLAEDPTQSPRFSPHPHFSSPSPTIYPASPLPDQVNWAAVATFNSSSSSSHVAAGTQFRSPSSPSPLKRSADQITNNTTEQWETAKRIFTEMDRAPKLDINDVLKLKNLLEGMYRTFQSSQPSPVQAAIQALEPYKKNPENLHTGLQLIRANYPHALTEPQFVSELNGILDQPFSVLFNQDFIQFLDNSSKEIWAAWGLVKIVTEARVDSPSYNIAYSPRTPSAQGEQVTSANFYVHKEKLTTQSEYFKGVFKGDFETAFKGTNETTLHNMHRDSFAEILKWCYSNTIEITEDNGSNLLFTVEFFGIPALKKKVENFYFNGAKRGAFDLIELYELGVVAQSQRIMQLALLNMLYARAIRKTSAEDKAKITAFLMQAPKFKVLKEDIAKELKKITKFSTETYPNIVPNRTFLWRLTQDTGVKEITIIDNPRKKYVDTTLLSSLHDSRTLESVTIESGNSAFKIDFLTTVKLPKLEKLTVGEIAIGNDQNLFANFKSDTLQELSLTVDFSGTDILSQTFGGVRGVGLQHLMHNLPKLRELGIGGGILAPDDLLVLNTSSSPDLKLFYLLNHKLTDEHLINLATIERLEKVDMGLTLSVREYIQRETESTTETLDVTNKGLIALAEAYPEQKLIELSLLCTQKVTDQGVSALSRIKTLTTLSLENAAITGTCFLSFKDLKLKELSLCGCGTLKTNYLDILASLGISRIDLRDTNLTSNELATHFQPHGYTGFNNKILVLSS